MIVESLQVGVFAENCYIVGCPETNVGIVIDPGDEVDRILDKIKMMQLSIKYILLTHGHIDHVKEVNTIKESLQVPVMIHRDDKFLLDNLPTQAAAFGLSAPGVPEVDHYLDVDEKIKFGNIVLEVYLTPGHSPGHVTFFTKGYAFSGDVLFAGSIGRTDLPGGNYEILIDTIKNVIIPFGDETIIYPGHGPETSVGKEKLTNPFLLNL